MASEITALQCWEAHAKAKNPQFFATMHPNTRASWQRVADVANAALAAERARVVAEFAAEMREWCQSESDAATEFQRRYWRDGDNGNARYEDGRAEAFLAVVNRITPTGAPTDG